MTNWPRVADDQLKDLIAWMAVLSWPIDKARMIEMGEARGWTVVSNRPGKGARFDTRLAGDQTWASLTMLDEAVAQLTVTTSAVVRDETPESVAFIRDQFAEQVQLVTDYAGEPSLRQSGAEPSTAWLLPNGSSVTVQSVAGMCSWLLKSPELTEIQSELKRRGIED